MIRSIALKFGSSPGEQPLHLETAAVTVFVGPNNSGKSKVLQEIRDWCIGGVAKADDLIVDGLKFDGLSPNSLEESIAQITLKPRVDRQTRPGQISIGLPGSFQAVERTTLERVLQCPEENILAFCQWYLRYQTLMLDGKGRIELVAPQPSGDLLSQPTNSLQKLFVDDEKRLRLRGILHEAFGSFFIIDPSNIGHLRIRYSLVAPTSTQEERGLHRAALEFHGSAEPIDIMSDGVKAFTGIMMEIVAGDPKILLIDEPEAFLHPSLSRKLGKEIAEAAMKIEKRVFIATHSPSFVMGCVQSGVSLNIVRLTYRKRTATARLLAHEQLLSMMRDPLLRSTKALEALFYEYVIVTESDSDRAFYEEVNQRLLNAKDDRGIPNCLFINAQSKQTIGRIVGPLREIGIPTAGIADIDVIKEGGSVWGAFMGKFGLPQAERNSLATLRATIMKAFESLDGNMKRDGGIYLLDEDHRAAAVSLFDKLGAYGFFVVRKGELESWLPNLNVRLGKPKWLIRVFEELGSDPKCESYVQPAEGDAWDFIGTVKKWLTDEMRSGIPK